MPKTKTIEYVLFDVGGVLYNVDWKASLNLLPIDIELNAAKSLIENWKIFLEFEKGKITPFDFHKKLNKRLNIEIDFNTFKHSWNSCLIGMIDNVPPLLLKIKNCKKAALSNTNLLHCNHFSTNPCFNDFSHILTSFNLFVRKPNIAIYKKTLQILKVSPSNILFIDDLEENLHTAANLGFNTEHCINSAKTLESILKKYELID